MMMDDVRLTAILIALSLVVGCGDGSKKETKDTGTQGADTAQDTRAAQDTDTQPDVGVDTSVPDTESDTMTMPMANWCERIEPGPGTTSQETLPLELSRIHRRVRFFGAHVYSKTDEALADALVDNSDAASILTAYADALPTVCHLTEKAESLGSTEVDMVGKTAVIRPGKDKPQVSGDPDAVVIDLRDLPATTDTMQALERAVSPFLGAPVSYPAERGRLHEGLVDEYLAPMHGTSNIYSTELKSAEGGEIASTGAVNHSQLVLRTGEDISPQAARLALALRKDGYASIIGRSVPTRIAEARWVPSSEGGLVFKSRDLLAKKDGDEPLPDVIPADVELEATAEPSESKWKDLFDKLPDRLTSPDSPAERTMMAKLDPPNDKPASDYDAGDFRADLLVAHGAASLFYGYIDEVASSFDDRLEAVWKDAQSYGDGANDDEVTRRAVHRALFRLLDVLDHGHIRVDDFAEDSTSLSHDSKGYLAIHWEVVKGEPVVRYSAYNNVSPGDKLIEYDGTTVKKHLDKWRKLVSATNKDSEVHKIMASTRNLDGPVNLLLEKPDGTQKQVMVKPKKKSEIESITKPDSTRKEGWLKAPNDKIYYVNLDRSVVEKRSVWMKVQNNLANAEGLVIDLRSFGAKYLRPRILADLTDENLPWATFKTPEYDGSVDNHRWLSRTQTARGRASQQVADMPVAVLVDVETGGGGEGMAASLWMNDVARVFGRETAGANGNITTLRLPGMFGVRFTGVKMELKDGSSFRKKAIDPDVTVAPTASSIANGEDPVLDAATKWINNN